MNVLKFEKERAILNWIMEIGDKVLEIRRYDGQFN
jgi:hypothetical protein